MSTVHTIHEGGCACGQVRYQIEDQPNNTTNCYCTQCRAAVGAPLVTWSEFPRSAVTFTSGEPKWFKSSDWAERGFCETCGTALTFRYIEGDALDIATATLDEPDTFPSEDHLWVSSKPDWLVIGDDLPQYPRERGSG